MSEDDQHQLSELITLFDELDADARELVLTLVRRLVECLAPVDLDPALDA